ncbi:MAG: HlyC/CorC family transporter [Clostridia bacterium]|nr:HlyC/CorC family transporter [Clostridia bacterium]
MLGAAILQIILIALNAVFACAEIAIISTSESKLERIIDDGGKGDKRVKRAKRVLSLVKDSSKALSTIQVAITLASLMGSAYAADNFAEPLAAWLAPIVGLSLGIVEKACVFAITLVLSYFSIVVGELVPKRLAMKNPEKVALGLSGILKTVSVIFAPFVFILTLSTNAILRLFGIDPDDNGETVTEEDILSMLDTGSESGTIDSSESEMIQNVFEFDDTSVSEICTHRRDVTFLYPEDGIDAWRETIVSSRHTYYPICGANDDDVIAVLNIRNFFRIDCKDTETAIKEAAEKPFFVPENMKADVLLTQMKKARTYFAVVIDEYGGTRGVITLHDVLEVLVGTLGDEDDEPLEAVTVIDENTWEILGSASIGEVEKALDVELGDDSETFGGYVMGLLGAIPEDGSTVYIETEELKISVCSVSDRRIEKTVVVRKTEDEKEAEENEKAAVREAEEA